MNSYVFITCFIGISLFLFFIPQFLPQFLPQLFRFIVLVYLLVYLLVYVLVYVLVYLLVYVLVYVLSGCKIQVPDFREPSLIKMPSICNFVR